MIVNKASLLTMAVKKEQYPKDKKFEIAFAGKSNVGKSSLINALTNRTNLARTSGTPGKTQTINFYNVNDKFRFVDLPGYGYAKVSKGERQKWSKMIDDYLHYRENLIEVILLIDSRHVPGEHDKLMFDWIKHYGFNGIVVATKADKLSKNQLQKQINIIQKDLNIENSNLIVPFSATKKYNVDYLWDIVEEILRINEEQLIL